MTESLRLRPPPGHDSDMGTRTGGGWWLLVALAPALLLASLAWAWREGLPMGFDAENAYPNLLLGVMLPLLGWLVVSRLPRHPVGWLLLGTGVASVVTVFVYVYALDGLVEHPGTLPGALAAGWVSSWVWALGLAPLVSVGLLLFPDGRLPGRRWWPLLALDVAAVTLLVLGNAFLPGPLVNHPVADNPLGAPLPRGLVEGVAGAGFVLLVVGMAGSAVGAVVRWRRAADADRAALSWFALAVVVVVASVLVPLPASLKVPLLLVATPLLPLSFAVPILRGQLLGIQVAVSRSLVLTSLTVVLVLAYSVTVLVVGAALGGSGDRAAALTATAVVAVGFAPARARLQVAADRLVYGERRDAWAAIAGLNRTLDVAGGSAQAVLTEIARTLATSLRLPYVRVEVGGQGDAATLGQAVWGTPTPAVRDRPLSFQGAEVGVLQVSGGRLRPEEERLLDDVAGQVGIAAHAMLVSADLQRSREQLVTLREEERRRMRRDLHDGLGPALAGVALGLDAVRRLATQRSGEAADLAGRLITEVHTCLADVRRLVEDLRPPALDQLGLVGALEQQARQLSERDAGLDVTVDAGPVTALPAAVEVAAYRIATEALTNTARHARARRCAVRLSQVDGELRLEVEDDGVGIGGAERMGVGMHAMRERAVELGGSCQASDTGHGTTVRARLPMGTP